MKLINTSNIYKYFCPLNMVNDLLRYFNPHVSLTLRIVESKQNQTKLVKMSVRCVILMKGRKMIGRKLEINHFFEPLEFSPQP